MDGLNRNNINPIFSLPCTIATTSVVHKITKQEPLDDDLIETSFQNPKIASSNSFYFHLNPSSISPISPHTPIHTQLNLPSVLDDSSNVYLQTAFGMNNYVNEDCTILEDPKTIIVPFNSNRNSQTQLAVLPRKNTKHSRELVRANIHTPEGIQNFERNEVRRIRIVYNSLRLHALKESENNRSLVEANSQTKKITRSDLQAAQLMTDCELLLHRDKRIVGSIPGVEIGDVYLFCSELRVIGLHEQSQAGIDYLSRSKNMINELTIATSVIVSEGHKDDMEDGDDIIYCGQGVKDKDQKMEGGNLALKTSMEHGIEVRVIRGIKYEGSATGKVYVYDGLYRIVHFYQCIGKSGFLVYKYRLERIANQPKMGSSIMRLAMGLRTMPLEVGPKGYVNLDISMQKENVPVLLFNDLDDNNQPASTSPYEYLVTVVFPQIENQGRNGIGCDCVGGCILNGCSCAERNGGEIAYANNDILIRGKPVVLECGPHCKCPLTCRNRVSQRGLKKRLEVFRKSGESGWGVRSLDLIQAGSFICEFSGVVLTHEQVEIFTMDSDNLVYSGRFAENRKEWGDLSDIYSDFVHPSYPSIPPLDFAMDVSTLRNVACYISHNSSPNIFIQPVLYDHDNVSFPHLMLFAMENIPPLRELSLEYGVDGE